MTTTALPMQTATTSCQQQRRQLLLHQFQRDMKCFLFVHVHSALRHSLTYLSVQINIYLLTYLLTCLFTYLLIASL